MSESKVPEEPIAGIRLVGGGRPKPLTTDINGGMGITMRDCLMMFMGAILGTVIFILGGF